MDPKHSERVDLKAPAANKPASEQERRQARRALLRLGAGAAPVLLTLPSAPVGAAQLCVLASSYVSPNTFSSHNAFMGNTMQCTMNSGVIGTYITEAHTAKTALDANPAAVVASPYGELVSVRLGSLGADPPGVAGYATMKVAHAMYLNGYADASTVAGAMQHLLALSIAVTKGDFRNPAAPYSGNFDTAYISSIWQNMARNGFTSFTGGGLSWPYQNVIAWARTAMGLYGAWQ